MSFTRIFTCPITAPAVVDHHATGRSTRSSQIAKVESVLKTMRQDNSVRELSKLSSGSCPFHLELSGAPAILAVFRLLIGHSTALPNPKCRRVVSGESPKSSTATTFLEKGGFGLVFQRTPPQVPQSSTLFCIPETNTAWENLCHSRPSHYPLCDPMCQSPHTISEFSAFISAKLVYSLFQTTGDAVIKTDG